MRESGSGTRDIIERILYEKNLNKDHFESIIEIGNMNAIKELVLSNEGITFMYRAAAEKELASGKLYKIDVEDFKVSKEFNFVYLKDSIHEKDYLEWYSLFK